MFIVDQISLEQRDVAQEQAYADAYQEIWERGFNLAFTGQHLPNGCTDTDLIEGYIAGLQKRVFEIKFPFPVAKDCEF